MSPVPDADRANFLNQIEQVRAKFDGVDELSIRLNGLVDQLKFCTTTGGFKDIHEEYRSEISKASLFIKVIKSQIDALEVSNTDFHAKYRDEREPEPAARKVLQ